MTDTTLALALVALTAAMFLWSDYATAGRALRSLARSWGRS